MFVLVVRAGCQSCSQVVEKSACNLIESNAHTYDAIVQQIRITVTLSKGLRAAGMLVGRKKRPGGELSTVALDDDL